MKAATSLAIAHAFSRRVGGLQSRQILAPHSTGRQSSAQRPHLMEVVVVVVVVVPVWLEDLV